MSSLFALRALLFAGECLAASVVILALAWLSSFHPKRASLRHLVWLASFGALLALPLAAFLVPPHFVLERTAAVPENLPALVEPAAAAPSEIAAPAPAPAPSRQFDARDAAIAVFAVWLAGVVWAALRLVLAALGLSALRRASRPHTLASADLPRVGGGRACELRLSASQDGPMTWGILRPVILLPKESLDWPRARLQAVLLHELAHVRRRDSLTQSLSLIACALYWPNPLVWMATRALRREAEIAADDAVIVAGVKPSTYAGELVSLASEFRGRRAAFSGVSMAGSALEARVKSALAPHQTRTGVTSMDALKIALLGVAATAALALARPDVVDAQVPPPAPVAAPAELPPPPPVPAVAPVPPVPPVAADDEEDAHDADDADDASPSRKVFRSVQVRETHDKHHRHVERTVHIVHLNRADIDRAEADAGRADAELARAEPEIEKAMDEAKIDEKVAQAMRDVEPKIRAEIARAMAKAKPEIRRAIAEAHISEKIARALAEARPKIDAAIARANAAQKRVHIEVRRDDEAPGKVDEQDDQNDER